MQTIPFVENITDIIKNIRTIEAYLTSADINEQQFAVNLVRKGRTFLVYKFNGVDHFIPSRFLGYKNNTYAVHISNVEKDGRDTNPVISEILLTKPFVTGKIEKEFHQYCRSLQAIPDNNKRHFWRVRGADGTLLNLQD